MLQVEFGVVVQPQTKERVWCKHDNQDVCGINPHLPADYVVRSVDTKHNIITESLSMFRVVSNIYKSFLWCSPGGSSSPRTV